MSPILFDPARGPVPDTLSAVVGEAIGAASVCWEHMEGTGQFDDKRAAELVDEVLGWINTNYRPKPESDEALRRYMEEHNIAHVDASGQPVTDG